VSIAFAFSSCLLEGSLRVFPLQGAGPGGKIRQGVKGDLKQVPELEVASNERLRSSTTHNGNATKRSFQALQCEKYNRGVGGLQTKEKNFLAPAISRIRH
jgi:hypothetical protein